MLKIFHLFPTLTLFITISSCSTPFNNKKQIIKPLNEMGFFDGRDGFDSNKIKLPSLKKSKVESALKEKLETLDLMTPSPPDSGWAASTGSDLFSSVEKVISINKKDATETAVKNNLDLKIASYQPEISQKNIKRQEAAFDFVFGLNGSTTQNRTPQQTIPNNPFGSEKTSTDQINIDGSLVKKMYSGGSVTLSTGSIKTQNNNSDFVFIPNPAWQSSGSIGLTQPTLRGFGEGVTRAQINISQTIYDQTLEDFKLAVMRTVTETDLAYLNLSLQWKTLQVKEWLLEESKKTIKILELRRNYDTGESDYAQAVATQQQRFVDLVSQRSSVHKASDVLKNLMSSELYSLDSNTVLQPQGELHPIEVSVSLREAVLTAIEKRPDLKRLLLDIDINNTSLEVADNARLPKLDFQSQLFFTGLNDSPSGSYREVFDANFINYVVGLAFEIPIGNQAAESEYQSKKIEKMASVAKYKKSIQDIIVEVKQTLRDVITNAELMRANRSYRIAQAENMRALNIEEKTLSGLNPTFLNLKLQTQVGLANARISEITSIINYNKAIINLYFVMGTTLDMNAIELVQDTDLEVP